VSSDRDLVHFIAADAEHLVGEAAQRDAYLDQLDPDPAMRRALACEPTVLGWPERVDAASEFVTGPEDARNHARAVAQAVLDAAGKLAGSLGAARARKARSARQREKTAPRDAIVRELWAATDMKLSADARALTVKNRLWKQHRIKLSTRQILRIVGKVYTVTLSGADGCVGGRSRRSSAR
jgi:hypothetical protein